MYFLTMRIFDCDISKCTLRQHHRPPIPQMFFCLLFVFDSSTLDALLARRDSQNGETDRGDKSFSCGHPVWGLAFGPRPPRSAAACPSKWKPPKGTNSLLLATGLENGVIKIWNVLTGKILAGAVFSVPLSASSFLLTLFFFRGCCVWSPWPWRRGEGLGLPSEWDTHTHIILSGQDSKNLGPGAERSEHFYDWCKVQALFLSC